jgi:selenophosphate synthetase-related protein
MKLVLGSLRRRSDPERATDRAAFVHVRDVLVEGGKISPASVAAALAASDVHSNG